MEGRDAYKLSLTMNNGQTRYLWVDAQYRMPTTRIGGKSRYLNSGAADGEVMPGKTGRVKAARRAIAIPIKAARILRGLIAAPFLPYGPELFSPISGGLRC